MARPRKQDERKDMAGVIKQAARELMSELGTSGLSLRAIARRTGVSAPAIYHYFPRLENLITALIVDAFKAFADAIDQASAETPGQAVWPKFKGGLLAYRQWAVDHPVEFQLIYGNPIPGYAAPDEITVPLASRPMVSLARLFSQGVDRGEFRVPPQYDDVPSDLAVQFALQREQGGLDIPDGIFYLLLSGWARIHGLIMLELFHHIQPAVGDPARFYKYEVENLLSPAIIQKEIRRVAK